MLIPHDPASRPVRAFPLLAALLFAGALLAGCTADEAAPPRTVTPADVGHDPTTIHVTGTTLANVTIPSFDGATTLAALIRSPLTNDTLPDGSAARWPVVVFLHGWGGGKESFTGGRGGLPGSEAMGGVDRLEQFARAGFIAVAYDARGFGQSTGHADVAGPATMGDLGVVLDWVAANYASSGKVGVLGESYGAGQAYLAWAKDPRVTTAVPMYGWVDLADALIPNDVPKLEWAQFLYGYGLVGSQGRYDAMIHEWYTQVYTRSDLETVRAQMEERSALSALGSAGNTKPLLLCQGMQETLFPQADIAAQAATTAGAFVRTYVYTGGHGASEPACWSRALDWFQFFLAGFDTRVDGWPALETSDAVAELGASYQAWPTSAVTTYRLRAPDLVADASDATFTVRQSLSSSLDPSALPDLVGEPRPPVPDALRNDPNAVVFTGPAYEDVRTIVGSSVLRLDVQSGAAPFQVAAQLLLLRPDGTSVALGHAAFAALNATQGQAPIEMRFEWTHAQLQPGDKVQLRIAANDPGWWMPLLADYSVTFAGTSSLDVPFLA